MDGMDLLNYGISLAGALIGFFLARIWGASMPAQIGCGIAGLVLGHVSLFGVMLFLDWKDQRANKGRK